MQFSFCHRPHHSLLLMCLQVSVTCLAKEPFGFEAPAKSISSVTGSFRDLCLTSASSAP